MADLIRRNWLLDVVENVIEWDTERDRNRAIHQVRELTPAVDAVEEVRSAWSHLGGDEWLCPECGHVISTEGSWEHPLEVGKKHCENCGARMDGRREEGET